MIAILYPPNVWNRFWHIVGAIALPLNALRHGLQGYTRSRDIDPTSVAQAIHYDWEVAARWRKALRGLDGSQFDLNGKAVLELGPGPDLGVGLILLAYGATSYTAIDRHPLALKTTKPLYDELLLSIMARLPEADEQRLRREVDSMDLGYRGTEGLRYICRDDFLFADVPEHSIDLIVSNAAFEHFDDVDDVIKRLTPLARPGCRFVADIDLQTHSRIIRARDPLNIYRYSDRWYRRGTFVGVPNRVRPIQYRHALESAGWRDVEIQPLLVLDEHTVKSVRPLLAPRFQDDSNQIEILDFLLVARI